MSLTLIEPTSIKFVECGGNGSCLFYSIAQGIIERTCPSRHSSNLLENLKNALRTSCREKASIQKSQKLLADVLIGKQNCNTYSNDNEEGTSDDIDFLNKNFLGHRIVECSYDSDISPFVIVYNDPRPDSVWKPEGLEEQLKQFQQFLSNDAIVVVHLQNQLHWQYARVTKDSRLCFSSF